MNGTGFDPSKRIPRDLRGNDTLYGHSFEDISVLSGPILFTMVIGQNIPAEFGYLSIPIYATGVLMSALILYLTPDHLTSKEWMEGIANYLTRPQDLRHISLEEGMAREQPEYPEDSIFGTSERTQDITNIERIHKHAHAIEREDGTMVGAIKVEPANMALASNQRWNQLVNKWEAFLNNTLEYPIQIYGTTQTFPVEDYISQYNDRLNSPDLEQRPILKAVLRSFVNWYPEYLRWQGTNQRNYYIIVTVEPDEVYHVDSQEKGVVAQLADLPGLGPILTPFINTQSDKTPEDRRREQLKVLAQRCKEIEHQGIRSLKGCSPRRLSGAEFAILLKEYWEGRELDFDPEEAVRTIGAVKRGEEPVTQEEVATDTGYGTTTDK